MRLSLRFLLPVVAAIAVFAYVAAPLADRLLVPRFTFKDIDGELYASDPHPVNGDVSVVRRFLNVWERAVYGAWHCCFGRAKTILRLYLPSVHLGLLPAKATSRTEARCQTGTSLSVKPSHPWHPGFAVTTASQPDSMSVNHFLSRSATARLV